LKRFTPFRQYHTEDIERGQKGRRMANDNLSPVTRFLRRVLAPHAHATSEDGQLLRQFAESRDEDAFAVLVWRHGPMVLGVCRRVLRHTQDAEDAFQASFLVLARKAGAIKRPGLLGNWLYGVAYRTSLKVRTETARRRSHETTAGNFPVEAAAPDSAPDDLGRLLDEEIRRLPEKYRRPFLLCYLEGQTNEEAARLLGCPKGTVLSRLAWARQRLRSRLTRRGVTPSAGLFTLLLAQTASVPAVLVRSTVQGATLFVGGRAVVAGAVSLKAIPLAEGVLQAMFASKLKIAAVFAVGATLTAVLGGMLTFHAFAEKPPAAKPKDQPAPAPAIIAFKKTSLTIDELIAATGLNIYKFQLDMAKGQKFRVAVTKFPSKEADPQELKSFEFQKTTDGPMMLHITFLPLDGKLHGVLMGKEEEVDFRVSCDGCDPSGWGTIIPNPGAEIPADGQLFAVFSNEKGWAEGSKGKIKAGPTTLLALFASKPGIALADLSSAYPRAELTVERLPSP
jgi:RNA polymerase sigma factor (sigma-70 family)